MSATLITRTRLRLMVIGRYSPWLSPAFSRYDPWKGIIVRLASKRWQLITPWHLR
jgi:hypothetical protein